MKNRRLELVKQKFVSDKGMWFAVAFLLFLIAVAIGVKFTDMDPNAMNLQKMLAAPDDVESQIEVQALGASISAFLYRIPQQQRDIFLRRYWYFDSVSAIAKRFLISESKVKTTLFRIRNQLREHLEKEGFVI